MGCHTWFYKKANLTLEECKKRVITMLEQYNMSRLDNLDNCEFGGDEDICDSIKYTNRIISWIKKGWLAESCYRLLDEIGYYDINTKIYYVSDKDMPFDVFRIGDYPDIKLRSLQETIDFLEKNDDKISYRSSIFDKTDRNILKEKAIEKLKEFWEKNPDGMIDFG